MPTGLFLSNIDGGGGSNPLPLYDFALRVEIGESDTCSKTNFSRPAHVQKNIPLTLMIRV